MLYNRPIRVHLVYWNGLMFVNGLSLLCCCNNLLTIWGQQIPEAATGNDQYSSEDGSTKAVLVFFYCQYFEHVEEAEWAVQALKATGKPVAATLCIGPEGDLNGISPGECGVRLVKAGMYCTEGTQYSLLLRTATPDIVYFSMKDDKMTNSLSILVKGSLWACCVMQPELWIHWH